MLDKLVSTSALILMFGAVSIERRARALREHAGHRRTQHPQTSTLNHISMYHREEIRINSDDALVLRWSFR
jgi:hypothetical protein